MKERFVDSMCMTWRHDFGLDKAGRHELSSGMTTDERAALRRDMAQLFEHHVAPLIAENAQLRAGAKGDFDLDAWLEWAKEAAKLRQDAERYRALREMNWCDGPLAVVADPYSRIKLGSDCPSHERLDQVVDSIVAKAASADAGVVDYD